MLDMAKLGAKLIDARQRQGLTQDELGERLGISAQAVSKWERGLSLPDTGILPDIARVLKLSLDNLLDTGGKNTESKDEGKTAEAPRVPQGNWTGDFEMIMRRAAVFDEVLITFSTNLFSFYGIRAAVDRLLGGIRFLRRRVYNDTGIMLPKIRFVDDIVLPENDAVIYIRGKEIWRETFFASEDYAKRRTAWETFAAQGDLIVQDKNDKSQQNWEDVLDAPAENLDAADRPVTSFACCVLTALRDAVLDRLTVFNTLDHAARIIEITAQSCPALAAAVTPGLYTLAELRGVYNILLREKISIKGQLTILELLLDFKTAAPDGDTAQAAGYVKSRL